MNDITEGSIVKHPKFGKGLVNSIRPASEVWDTKGIAEVQFENGQQKTFLLRFSKLEVIGHLNPNIKAANDFDNAVQTIKDELIRFFRIDKIVEWLAAKLK